MLAAERLGQVGVIDSILAQKCINFCLFFTDHVAVGMFINDDVPFLTLHLPTRWEHSTAPGGPPSCFHDSGDSVDSRDNPSPGRTANKLHQEFSWRIGEVTLDQLEIAQMLGATTCVHKGFQARNAEVAKSKYLLAFTWGEGNEPKKGGGTRSTWDKCSGRKLHVPLSSLLPAGHGPPETDNQSHASTKRRRTNSLDMFVSHPAKKPCP